MKAIYTMIAAATLLAGPVHAADPTDADVPPYALSMIDMLTPALKKQCREGIIENLNDPSSYQRSGPMFVNFFALLMNQQDPGTAVTMVQIRAKNTYGALVRETYMCHFDQAGGVLTFKFAQDSPVPPRDLAYTPYPVEDPGIGG